MRDPTRWTLRRWISLAIVCSVVGLPLNAAGSKHHDTSNQTAHTLSGNRNAFQ